MIDTPREVKYKQAVKILETLCDSVGHDRKHKARVLDAFKGAPRKRITFSAARKMVGLTDARSWYNRCSVDPLLKSVEVMPETKTSAYCWEDEILLVLSARSGANERDLSKHPHY